MTGNILLVEDEKSLNRAVSLKLSKEGYMIYPAESIGQAKQLFESKDISAGDMRYRTAGPEAA